MLISVSYLKNKDGIKKAIDDINKSNADYIHVDVMDKIFVSEETPAYSKIEEALIDNKKKLDVHLMVENPLVYIKDYMKLNPEYITIHSEIKDDIKSIIKYLKDNNIKVGLALNPDTRVYSILDYINDIDLVLVMSVYPGKGGQKFIFDVTRKINELKALQKKYHYIINVDGGINNETIKDVNSDMVVSGSYVVMSDNIQERIDSLRKQK